MRVTPDSPVEDKSSYLYQWDSAVRKYFHHFEIHKTSTKEGIHRLFQSFFTSFKDPIQYRHRLETLDLIYLRQLLGDISKEEVSELNKVMGGQYYYTKSSTEPAKIFAWRWLGMAAFTGLGFALAGYARFVRGYNILWFIAPFTPLWSYCFYNWAR